MRTIQGTEVTFRYPNGIDRILDNIQFRLDNNSKVGLIGDNGCGKTTLLKIITGELQPIGNLKRELKIGYLSQEVDSTSDTVLELIYSKNMELLKLKKSIESPTGDFNPENYYLYDELNGWEIEHLVEEHLTKFNLKSDILSRRVSTLSGGEKTKVNIISILISEPEILLLDEPTNHLDLVTIEWLENYLKNQKLPYLIISHDREFLDRTIDTIWEIKGQKLEVYSGNYTFYKNLKDEIYNNELHLYQVQTKKIKKLNKALNQLKGNALSHQAETGTEGYAPVYENVRNLAKKSMKHAKVMENRIDLLIEKEECKKPDLKHKPRILFEESAKNGKNALKIEGLNKSYSKAIFEKFNLQVKHGERVAITGKNGSGKTTLLRIIAGLDREYTGKVFIPNGLSISYFSQEYENLDSSNTILEEVSGGVLYNQGNIRRSLASVGFPGDSVFRVIYDLSPGERSKVAIVKIMLSNSTVLLLDEPTNHLEISTREVVEESLLNFNGTIIFVSHDRRFVEKLSTRVVEL